jgi:hypothetical protein
MYSTIINTLAERNLEISNTELTYKGKCEFPYQYSQRRFSRDFSAPDGGKLRDPADATTQKMASKQKGS